jgi:hypothetical protein
MSAVFVVLALCMVVNLLFVLTLGVAAKWGDEGLE